MKKPNSLQVSLARFTKSGQPRYTATFGKRRYNNLTDAQVNDLCLREYARDHGMTLDQATLALLGRTA